MQHHAIHTGGGLSGSPPAMFLGRFAAKGTTYSSALGSSRPRYVLRPLRGKGTDVFSRLGPSLPPAMFAETTLSSPNVSVRRSNDTHGKARAWAAESAKRHASAKDQ